MVIKEAIMEKMRLNKFLSEAGVASRRKADELILEGRIEVNGKVVNQLGFKIDPEKDEITFDGEPVKLKNFVYYLFHKPAGYITSLKDEKGRKTIFDIIKVKERVFPVGRLDRDTTGVLILTNDGDFANFLMHPKNKIPREYIATLDKPFEEPLTKLKKVHLEDGIVNVDSVEFIDSTRRKLKLILREGRNRVVKRIFGKFGYSVKALHRSSYAGFRVDKIPVGKLIKISPSEIKRIYTKYDEN